MCHNAKIRILISFANFLILILISFLPSWRNVGMRLYGKFCFFVCMLHRELNGGSLDAFSESDEERMSKIIIFAYVSSTAVDMDYDIKDKMEWTIIFIREFGRKYGLSMKQAFNYLSRFKGIDFIDRHYDYVHTQSFASMVDDIAEYCHRHGGALV